jgi:hypothetical protein
MIAPDQLQPDFEALLLAVAMIAVRARFGCNVTAELDALVTRYCPMEEMENNHDEPRR